MTGRRAVTSAWALAGLTLLLVVSNVVLRLAEHRAAASTEAPLIVPAVVALATVGASLWLRGVPPSPSISRAR